MFWEVNRREGVDEKVKLATCSFCGSVREVGNSTFKCKCKLCKKIISSEFIKYPYNIKCKKCGNVFPPEDRSSYFPQDKFMCPECVHKRKLKNKREVEK